MLIIIRDMMFGNRRHFRELLHNSQEGIASNTLSDRLRRHTERGLVSRAPDPSHKQKVIYSLTNPPSRPIRTTPRGRPLIGTSWMIRGVPGTSFFASPDRKNLGPAGVAVAGSVCPWIGHTPCVRL